MRIGIEVSALDSRITGTSRYLSCLIEQLEKSDNEIIKFSPYDNHLLKFPTRKRVGSLRKHLYRNFSLKNDLISAETDCAIFPDYLMPAGYKKPSAIVIHDLTFISHPQFYSQKFVKYYNYRLKQTLKQTPLVVAVSQHTRSNIKKYLGVPDENILIVQGYSKVLKRTYNRETNEQKERPYFLFVGHIEPRKNINFMIEGFLRWKQLSNNDFKLKIVGLLWIKSHEINLMLKKYLKHPDIEFTGFVEEDLLPGIFSNAAGFIHTSYEEGFGFPVLEAMEYGLPVLCTKNISTEEISSPQSVTIDPKSTKSFIDGLETLSEISKSIGKIKYDIKYSPTLMQEQLNHLLNRLEYQSKKIIVSNIPRAKSKMEAIEKTFIYSSLFNEGIRIDNLHRQIFDILIEKDELRKFINTLNIRGIVKQENDLIFLNNVKNGFYKKSKNKINRIKFIKNLQFLDRLPFVSCIAFSGGTSHYGLENHDDIDLFIITKPYALYMVYLIIHIYSLLTKSRKELCVNYLIDEYDLQINHSYDFYTAHQIISLTAYKNYLMLNRFWKQNEWVKYFYPNFTFDHAVTKTPAKLYKLLNPVNTILMFIYRKVYKNKLLPGEAASSVLLTEHTIKLHTKDHRLIILKEFEKVWSKYLERKRIKNSTEKNEILEELF